MRISQCSRKRIRENCKGLDLQAATMLASWALPLVGYNINLLAAATCWGAMPSPSLDHWMQKPVCSGTGSGRPQAQLQMASLDFQRAGPVNRDWVRDGVHIPRLQSTSGQECQCYGPVLGLQSNTSHPYDKYIPKSFTVAEFPTRICRSATARF